MGKHGPCYHCGATSTPLWRNGPPEKPVLCNACGSRWRTKGSLTNYTPLHARTEHDDFEDCRMARLRAISIRNKEATRVLKRKQILDNNNNNNNNNNEPVAFSSDNIHHGSKNLFGDEDTSNRSSSGSAISYSESCAQFSGDLSDFTDPVQTRVWDSTVPSRKRTCVNRPKQSSVEKLTKDLYAILQEQPFSCFLSSSEDDLLYENDKPMVSVEIGHGSVLIRHPNSIPREEESEASSLSFDNKHNPINEAYSHRNSKNVDLPRQETEKFKKSTGRFLMEQKLTKSDHQEKVHMLSHHDSPLRSVCLKDVINFDVFMSWLTMEEQLQLFKYLPSIDTSRSPESLKSMFQSKHLEESLHFFQKLIGEGVFENTISEMTIEGLKNMIRNPKRSMIKVNHENMKLMENDYESGFCPTTRFSPDNNSSSLFFDSFQTDVGYYDQDLLLDVPSNSSFPQAELLLPTSSFV